MKLWMKIAIVSSLGFGGGFASIYISKSSGDSATAADGKNEKPSEIDWSTLRELDVATGKMTPNLQKFSGGVVRVPGFMIPLEDNQSDVSEFLLVPSPMACIHVPPPPPNQIVHVRMAGGKKAKMSYGPIWLQGRLRVAEVNGPYGKSAYEITGELTEPFQ